MVGLSGGLALIVFVSFDVDMMLEQQSAAVGWNGAWVEIAEHVVLPLLVLMVPMYFAARWVIRTSLAPLGLAATHMDLAAGNDRGFRLDVDHLPVEAQPFARALNNMLKRLDETIGQYEAFAADAAHELRTPLAILMVELDHMGSPDAMRLKKDVATMNRIVGQIMLMSQVDAYAAAPIARGRISLSNVAMNVTARFAPMAVAQDKHIEVSVEGRPVIFGIKDTLDVALGNLVENGLRVTPVGGVVVVTAGPGARIGVRDEGPGLTNSELASLSQRFIRSSNASATGAGLGLAIVARIAEIHGAELATDPEQREIYLSFPTKALCSRFPAG